MSKTCFATVLKKREEAKKPTARRKKSPARKRRTEQTSRAWKKQAEALVQKYNQADLDKLQSVYYNHANRICHTMPRNVEEYHKAVRVLFGVTIPYTSCSEEMDAPFTYFYDLMMAINETVVVIAPRAGSKTYYTSIAHFLVNMWLPQHLSVHAGGTESQAMYSSDYLQDFGEVPVLASTLTKRPARLSANWLNGSRWFISKSSRSGISGSHPHKLTGDEVEFWKPSGIRQALGNAIPYDRYGIYRQAQTIFFSTRQTVTGGAYWLTEEADKRGFKKYEWSIFEVMKPCATCFSYTTPVTMADGSKRIIGTLVNKKITAAVKSYDPEIGKFVSKNVVGWVRKTHAPDNWYRIGLKRGDARTIGSRSSPGGAWITPDHEMYTQRGKVAVQDLLPTDRILTTHACANFTQKQIIDGTLLGDASMRKPDTKKADSRYSFVQTDSRKEYVECVQSALSTLNMAIRAVPARGFSKSATVLQSYCTPAWHEIYKRWYTRRGPKIVPKDLEITPLVLACWYMDDGTLKLTHGKFRQVKFCTEGFSKSSFWRLFYKMVDYGFKPRAVPARNGNFQLVLGETNGDVDRLFTQIAKYVPDCCRYKLTEGYDEYDASLWAPTESEPYYSDYELVKATPSTREQPHTAYCLEVEDTHNFVVHGMVVSNCVAIDRNPFGSDSDRMQTCLLWEDCQGVKARKSTGWIPRRRVIATKRKNSQEDWDSQYLCVKPATGGLVYPEFIHEYGPEGNYTEAEYDPELPLYAWSDPSEGATAVVYLVQVSRCGNFLNVIDEIVVDRCPNTMTLKREVADHLDTYGYDIPEYIVIDPHRRDAGADWGDGTATGTGTGRSWNVVYPSGKKELGGQEIVRTISMCKKYICTAAGKRILKVNPINCPRLCKAIRGYAYKVDEEGMRIGNNPQKRFSDEMDTMRYGLLYFDQNSVISVSNSEGRSRITVLAG